MKKENKFPKTILGIPTLIDYTCPPNQIYLIPRKLSENSQEELFWVFPHRIKITKNLIKSLKEMLLKQRGRKKNEKRGK